MRDAARIQGALLAAALLVAGASQAGAAATTWQEYGQSESGFYFYDTASVRVEKNLRRVWRLFDLRARGSSGVQSGMALVEINCTDSTYRYLRTMYYDGPKGHGKYLGGASEMQFDHIGPGSMIGQLAGKLC